MNVIQFLWKIFVRIKNPTCKIRATALSRNVKFEKGVTVEYGTVLQAGKVGKYTFINKYCLIDKNTESIGRFCSIAYNVRIGLGSHPVHWVSTHPFPYDRKYGFVDFSRSFEESKKKTVIENDVWIGANVTILAGVKVGNGAIIGAHSLVTKDVEPYSIVYGVPAEHKRFRFDKETRMKLLALEWWKWEDEKIKKNVEAFNDPASFLERYK